ncbi:hypothetical protein PG994_002478 [Apiospora phragmitis]|uniref:Clr5 domain-containing protein n=1 Tax=Apiospora phragmitis TaxID=2905665 RepID=A0ABR1WWG4_9PEZI
MSTSDSSSEPSPKQQDDVPWAKPEEFEAKKGIITHLYDLSGRNLTLKATMRIMEEQHGFNGTANFVNYPSSAKMYKSRISKWKLRKNLKPAEVIELVRQYKEREAAGKATHVYFRGERMDQRRLREYLRLVHGMTAGPAAGGEKRIKIEGITCRTPSPPSTPTKSSAQTIIQQLPMQQMRIRSPDDNVRDEPQHQQRSPELQRIVAFGFESGFWRRTPGGRVEPCAAVKSWYRKTLLVNRALQYGRMQLGFRLMQQCFDDFTALKRRSHHPYLWIYTHRVAMALAEQSPEAAQSFARLACNLSQALNHPVELAFDLMLLPQDQPNRSTTEASLTEAREICEFYRHLLMEQVGLHSFDPNDESSFATARTAHYDLSQDVELGYDAMHRIAKTRPEATPRPLPPQVEDLKRKEHHCWRTFYNGYYEEAAQILREISQPELIEDIAHYPDALFSYYDTAALLAQNRPLRDDEGNQELETTLGACRTLINLSTNEYGLDSLQTIDALASLEMHLRRRQQQHQWDQTETIADGVLQEIHAALDLLDYQTDPDLGNQQHVSSHSYTQRDPSFEAEWMDIPINPALHEMG